MEFQEDYEKEEREAIQTEDTAIDYSEDSLPFWWRYICTR